MDDLRDAARDMGPAAFELVSILSMNGMKGLVVARSLIPLWIESFIMLMKYQQVRQT